jgi:hypothetical protein
MAEAGWASRVENGDERGTLTAVLESTPVAGLIPARTAAFAVVALYLGVEMLSDLDGDTQKAESLLTEVGCLATLVDSLTNKRAAR